MIFAIDVDWSSLLQAAYVSAAFGIGVILVAGVAVIASLQAQDRERAHQGGAITLHVVTGVCVVAIVGAVVLGIAVMVNK
jgi:hypothetical protein